MKYCKGVVITGENTMAVSDRCPVPEEPCPHRGPDPSADLVPLHQRCPPVRHGVRLPALSGGEGHGP